MPRTRLAVDPRAKLALLAVISLVVLGGFGFGTWLFWARLALCFLLWTLMAFSGLPWLALGIMSAYVVAYFGQYPLLEHTTGLANSAVLTVTMLFYRFIPAFSAAYYLGLTTTVSQMIAALQRLRLGKAVVIPLTVMLRFVPVVVHEMRAVGRAARMRGLTWWGSSPLKFLEYRLLPAIACCANAGGQLSAAALTRGLGGSARRTSICEVRFGWLDYLIVAACLGVLVLAIGGW